MPFESINTNASQDEAFAWMYRMQAQGYTAASKIELSMRVIRDCQNVKDPLKIANRMMMGYQNLAEAARIAASHHDPVYRDATERARSMFYPQVIEQVGLAMDAYTNERKTKLANTKSAKRQLTMTEKSIEAINTFANPDQFADVPLECWDRIDREVSYWRDQKAALEESLAM